MMAFPNDTSDTTYNARRLLLNDRTIDTDNSKDRPDEAAIPACSAQSRGGGPYSRECLEILWKPNGSLTCLSLILASEVYRATHAIFGVSSADMIGHSHLTPGHVPVPAPASPAVPDAALRPRALALRIVGCWVPGAPGARSQQPLRRS